MKEPVRIMFDKFDGIQSLDDETKESLRAQISIYSRQLTLSRISEQIFRRLSLIIHRMVYLFILFGFPILYGRRLNVEYGIFGWIGIYIIFLTMFFFFLMLIFWPAAVARKSKDKLSINFRNFLNTWGYIWSLIAYIYLSYNIFINAKYFGASFSNRILSFAINSAQLGIVSYVLWVLSLMIIFLPIYALVITVRKVRYPEAIITERFIAILYSVENAPEDWDNERLRKGIVGNLEYIASVVQRYLFRGYLRADNLTNMLVKDNSIEIAEGIRQLKNNVLTPTKTSFGEFSVLITNYLIHATKGYWGEFPKIKPKYAHPLVLSSRIGSILRVIFNSILPLIVFLGIQKTPFAVSANLVDSLSVAWLMWATINIMSSFDPALSDKLDVMKYFSGLVSSSKTDP